jgi:uncharacterized damage-inducible protein DinB
MALLKDYLAIYARYNSFANERLLASIAQVPDEFYYRPVLAASRSIHGILNHILAADLAWIGELTQQRSTVTSRDQVVCETRAALLGERRRVDAQMTALVDQLSEDDLMSLIRYDDAAAGPLLWPLMLEVAHVFRHSAHHRGQLTILLEAAGIEAPKLDELFVPSDVVFEVAPAGSRAAA